MQHFLDFSQHKSLMYIWAALLDQWKKFFQINPQQLQDLLCSFRLVIIVLCRNMFWHCQIQSFFLLTLSIHAFLKVSLKYKLNIVVSLQDIISLENYNFILETIHKPTFLMSLPRFKGYKF